MKNDRLVCLLIIILAVLGVGLIFISTRAQTTLITVENADYSSENTTEYPADIPLVNGTRVMVEYSEMALAPYLIEPEYPYPNTTASKRVIVEYADYVSRNNLRISPDLNRDGTVNIVDMARLGKAFPLKPYDWGWNPLADMDGNEWVNIVDITMAAKEFGKTPIESINVDP